VPRSRLDPVVLLFKKPSEEWNIRQVKCVAGASLLVDCLGLYRGRIVGRTSLVLLSFLSLKQSDLHRIACPLREEHKNRYIMGWSRLSTCNLKTSVEDCTWAGSYREREGMSVKVGAIMKFALEVHISACCTSVFWAEKQVADIVV
jgi:hypothetical protein